MTARSALIKMYQEWQDWTEAEGEAIRAEEWAKVQDCQHAKSELQPLIMKATSGLKEEYSSLPNRLREVEDELRVLIGQLIQLEQRNSEWLTSQRKAAEIRNAELNRSVRHLRQIHQAYATADRAFWHSYS
jgi:hypothetical protein